MTLRARPPLLHRAAFGVLACFACLTACSNAKAPAAAEQPPEPLLVRQGDRLVVPEKSPLRARLQVAAVAEQAAPQRITLPAVVEANPARTVNVLPPLTGRLLTLTVGLGDTVKRGQLLATIGSPDLAQAVADAQKARDALDLAERALARARGVNEAGSNAAKDVEAAQSAVVQQQAELQRSQARLKTLGATGEALATQALKVTSPMDGVVTALNVGPGALLNDTTAPLLTVANLDTVWVSINVPEDLVGMVSPGQPVAVTVAAYPGRSFEGQVAHVGAALEADTRRVKARVAFANPGQRLKPNMYANAVLALAAEAQPQVPPSALLMNNDAVSVFVEVAPWAFMRRTVELGREDAASVRVRSGLRVGERVVVRGGVLLND